METSPDSVVAKEDTGLEAPVSAQKSLFAPPSLNQIEIDAHRSYTFHAKLETKECCILGVDEAGRGPVLGPMVYAAAYCPISFRERLTDFKFADSKQLIAETRRDLLQQIVTPGELNDNVGWITRVMSARDISAAMLRPVPYNLNAQAHDTTIQLIRDVVASGIMVSEAFIDTVGNPQVYEDILSRHFPNITISVRKKADSLFPIVSAASICAKVTRDSVLDMLRSDSDACDWGSGYPSDPRTISWLKETKNSVFGWNHAVRYSWQTSRDLIETETGIKVIWPEICDNSIASYFARPKIGPSYYGRSIAIDDI